MNVDGVLTINDTLEPKIWTNETLSPQISERLVLIAENFVSDLGIEGVSIDDITFTGSLANFNWTKFSDIDLHLIVDFQQIDENYDLVREYFSAKTSNWNKNHNIKIFGYEVEMYVQDSGEEHHSTGVYSIKEDTWITKPVRKTPTIDGEAIKMKAAAFADMIERAEDLYDDKKFENSHDFSVKLMKKIKKFRKSGLESNGEYSNENLVFKYLRNNDFIKQLHDLRNDSYDKMMSLEGDFDKKFKIYLNFEDLDQESGFNRLNELEKFQRKVASRHARMKKRLISFGKQKPGVQYTKKPNYKRSKSSPVGFGGS